MPVCISRMVTWAPTTTAPLLSVTVPEMVPVCALAEGAPANRATHTTRNDIRRDKRNLLIRHLISFRIPYPAKQPPRLIRGEFVLLGYAGVKRFSMEWLAGPSMVLVLISLDKVTPPDKS